MTYSLIHFVKLCENETSQGLFGKFILVTSYFSHFKGKLEKPTFPIFALSYYFRNCDWIGIDGEEMLIMKDYCSFRKVFINVNIIRLFP